MSRGRKMVEQRWGYAFWDVVRDFAEQGLDRAKVSRALGMHKDHLNLLLADNPVRDPFPASNKQLAYLRDTGEPFREAVERLQLEGVRVRAAAWHLGFADATALRRHLEGRGLGHYFRRKGIIEGIEQERGKPFEDLLRQLSAQGCSKAEAASRLGFKSVALLMYHMNLRGLSVQFASKQIIRSLTNV